MGVWVGGRGFGRGLLGLGLGLWGWGFWREGSPGRTRRSAGPCRSSSRPCCSTSGYTGSPSGPGSSSWWDGPDSSHLDRKPTNHSLTTHKNTIRIETHSGYETGCVKFPKVQGPRQGLVQLTWGLSGTGLQGAGLFGHRLGEGIAPSDDLPALVALHVPHPDAHPAGFGALRNIRTQLQRSGLRSYAVGGI